MSSGSYKNDPASCDVLDKVRLSTYRAHRNQWIIWCSLDERNSLGAQFASMVWFDAVFRLINETRHTTNTEYAAFNGVLAEAIDAGFVAGQVISIRKLIDRRGDTISLRRVAKDIEFHRALITREVFVCFDGLPYDHEAAEESIRETTRERIRVTGGAVWADGSAEESRRGHQLFDELSRKSPTDRSRDDLIDEEVFGKLHAAIDASGAQPLVKSANKFLLHAADEASRRNTNELKIILAQLTELHRNLARIGNFISSKLLWEGPCALGTATAQFDVLDRLDRPFIDPARRDELAQWWSEHSAITDILGYESLTL